ncbi:hypothetical protein ES702_02151 [subsurface metagenome]
MISMKIEVWILLRSRQAKRKKVSENKKEIIFNKGIYLMNRDAINFYSKGGKPKGVETFFIEDNPAPINLDSKDVDSSIVFLNRYIYENVIEQTGELPKERVRGAFNWVSNNVTIGAVVKWGFLLMIVGAIIGGYISGL